MRESGIACHAARLCAAAVVFGTLLLAGCAHHLRPMPDAHAIVVSGRSTANDDAALASRKIMVAAARVTLNHGFRFFRIAGSPRGAAPLIQPGADVTIEVFRDGEIDPRAPGVWDALTIGSGEVPNASR